MSDAALHVLVPAFGDSPFLASTLASAPRGAEILITVVDDGSPTPGLQRLADEAGVGYHRLPTNRGVAGAFQACVEMSRGTYTVIAGSDDVFGATYAHEVLRLVDAFDGPEMVQPAVSVINADGNVVRPLADRLKSVLTPAGEGLLAGDRLAASLLLGNWLYFPALAWRTDALSRYGFRQDMTTAMDLDLVLRLVFDGARLATGRTPVFQYRRHAGSVSSSTAAAGTRYAEERTVCEWARGRAQALSWHRSTIAAAWHPTARLHHALGVASRVGTRRS